MTLTLAINKEAFVVIGLIRHIPAISAFYSSLPLTFVVTLRPSYYKCSAIAMTKAICPLPSISDIPSVPFRAIPFPAILHKLTFVNEIVVNVLEAMSVF